MGIKKTTDMQISYPDEFSDPFFSESEQMMQDLDDRIKTNYEDSQSFVRTAANFTFNSGTGVLAWDAPIYLQSARGGGRLKVNTGNITLTKDPAWIYIAAPGRFITTEQVVSVQEIDSAFGLNMNMICIGYRTGNDVYIRMGFLNPGVVIIQHNSLAGIQGGAATEYYHMTQAQHDELTDVGGVGNASAQHVHDDRYYTISEIVDTTPGTEGASLVGTDAKPNLGGSVTVEEALEFLDDQDPIKHSEGAASPEGAVAGVWGDEYSDTTNTLEYKKMSAAGNTGWRMHAFSIDTVYVTSTPINITTEDNNSIFAVATAGQKIFNLPTAFNGGRYRITRSTGYFQIIPNGAEKIFVGGYKANGSGWWDDVNSVDGFPGYIDLVAIPGSGWYAVQCGGYLYDSGGSMAKRADFDATLMNKEGGLRLATEAGWATTSSMAIGERVEARGGGVLGFGADNYIPASYSGVFGEGAYSQWSNALMIGCEDREDAGGGDYIIGKKQGGYVILRGQTVGAAATDILETSDGNDLPTQEQTTLQLIITVTGRKSGVEDFSAAWEFKVGLEHRTAGAGGPIRKSYNKTKLWGEAGTVTELWDADVDIHNGGVDDGNVEITVQSNVGTVDWVAKIDWVEVGIGTLYTPVTE